MRYKTGLLKIASLQLALLLLLGNMGNMSSGSLFGQENREEEFEKLFTWAVNDFKIGKYHEVTRDLELLLSYFEEDSNNKNVILKGKIYLILGAAYEQLGQVKKAKKNYALARDILNNQKADIKIEGIDFSYLSEYQQVFMDNKTPVTKKPGIIEKPSLKHRKKHISPLLVLGGIVVIGGVTAVLLLSKKGPEEVEVDTGYDVRELGIEWVRIPDGEFLMGDNFNEGDPDEQPVHAVYLGEYYISRYEITFAQYDKFCEETDRQAPIDSGWGRGSQPVINISWGDAKAFCDWLSQKTTYNIHLPTEAQWEKAARGTDQRRYPWGNSLPDCSKANFSGCHQQAHPVGSQPAGVSPFGIHDMAGNVSEWCFDIYDPEYYSISQYNNPLNSTPEDPLGWRQYVIRGGSWSSNQNNIRCTNRSYGSFFWGGSSHQDTRSSSIGFRIVTER